MNDLFAKGIKTILVAVVSICTCGFVLCTNTAWAGAWLGPGDPGFRSDLRLLVDKGVLDVSTSTWPVSTRDIAGQLISEKSPYDGSPIFRMVPDHLEPHVEQALKRVRKRVQLEQKPLRSNVKASLANKSRYLRMGNMPAEGSEFSAALDINTEYAFARGRLSYVSEPEDGLEWRGDGSYLGLQLGNWALTAGEQNRWWGPGYDGSLVYSNNARPVPGIALQRVSGLFPWADWIDYIQFRSFMGQLESDRPVPEAKVFAARLEFSFFDHLEFGFSRSGHWGGENQPESLDNFYDYLIGKESKEYSGPGEGPTEPGNHLAGYDLRIKVLDNLAMYGQYIGEDAQGNLPYSFMGLFGLEGRMGLGKSGAYLDWYLEYADTLIAPFRPSDNKRVGVAYNHYIYKDGYRYRGRSLGHTIDGDSRLLSAGTVLIDSRGWTWRLHVSGGTLNKEGSDRPSVVAPRQDIDIYSADASLKYPITTGHSITASAGGLQREYPDSDQRLDGYFSLTWQKSFDILELLH